MDGGNTPDILTEATFKSFCDEIFKPRLYGPPILVVRLEVGEKMCYMAETKIIAEWPGYKKLRGPDGKEWFTKRNKSYADFARGSGNKSKRRMGYIAKPYFGGWENGCEWIKNEVANDNAQSRQEPRQI
jgi:hypothetical protein